MNFGKRANLLAASVTAATFVVLSVLPLTRDALRFDMQVAAGKPVLRSVLTDLGVMQSDLPFSHLVPWYTTRSGQTERDQSLLAKAAQSSPPATALSLSLASALQLSGRDKWQALQQVVAEFPDSPAAHATLVRIACKNGGAVGVGHDDEQEILTAAGSTRVLGAPKTSRPADPHLAPDAVIMLRSCAAGERIDADNAYFPAMAAIAHYALGQDEAARNALHRAAQKPCWREYYDVEADGRVRRAELLQGPQNTLTESATLMSILSPQYPGLRSMARVATFQAMQAEQNGDLASGLVLRRDVARLGTTMSEQSSTLIGNLVGIAILGVSEQRPGGAPVFKSKANNTEDSAQQTHLQFVQYLTDHGTQTDIAQWERYVSAGKATKAIVRKAGFVSAFGMPTLFQTQCQLFTNLLLLGAASLLCVLAGVAYLYPLLGKRTERAAAGLAVGTFIGAMLWVSWQTLGNVRDIMAFCGLVQALSSDTAIDLALAQAEHATLLRTLYGEGTLCLLVCLTLPVYLGRMALRAKRCGEPMGHGLRARTLPLAALLTIVYAIHLLAFSIRERTVRAELHQVITHEGRYVAAKLGQPWPQASNQGKPR